MAALRSIKSGEQGGASKKLSGVLLFSDGADNAELSGGVEGRAKTALKDFDVPVSTFLVGSAALKDLAALVYLVMVWIMMGRSTVAGMTSRAKIQDDGKWTVLILGSLSAMAVA